MSVIPIDLSMLDSFNDHGAHKGLGKPLLIAIDLVQEDPNQPRKNFENLLELTKTVSKVGIKVPVTVRPHPSMPGHYMLKFGARRRRAAIAAGMTHIPAWLEDEASDFEQVIENLQREDLTPLELAIFMAEKVRDGMKHAEIASRLGISRSAVSKHLALVNMPAEIEAVYTSGRSTSPETIFELRSLYGRFPEQTKAWLAGNDEVSRRRVDALKQALTEEDRAEPGITGVATKFQSKRQADAREIKRPVVTVKVGARHGIIVLNRRATEDGHVLVKWDDTAEIDEIANRDVQFLRLDDARRDEPFNRNLIGEIDPTASRTAKPTAPK